MGGLLSTLLVIGAIGLTAFVILSSAIKVVQEYERGVIFRLGRLVGAKGPGLFFIIPIVDRMVKVDLRVVTLDIPTQEAITKDNVTVKVNAVAYFRVVDPSSAIVQGGRLPPGDVSDRPDQLPLSARAVGAGRPAVAPGRDQRCGCSISSTSSTEPWGIKVSIVEVKDVELPETMKRAMARQAEAEREKRGKIIHAQGEFEASQQLTEAARTIGQEPGALQLRYLSTLVEIAAEKNSTIIFPLPMEFMRAFQAFSATMEDKPDA